MQENVNDCIYLHRPENRRHEVNTTSQHHWVSNAV